MSIRAKDNIKLDFIFGETLTWYNFTRSDRLRTFSNFKVNLVAIKFRYLAGLEKPYYDIFHLCCDINRNFVFDKIEIIHENM